MCTHCNLMLCQTCQTSHLRFEDAKSSLQELDVALHQARDVRRNSVIDCLISDMEMEVDQAVDRLVEKLAERRHNLKTEIRHIIQKDVDPHNSWEQQLKTFMKSAKKYLKITNKHIGDEYGSYISDQK